MATTQQLRSAVQRIAGQADRDLATLWGQVDTPAQARAALNDVLPALVRQYGSAAATVSAEWYDDLRVQREIRGGFRAITADLGTSGADSLAGYGAAAVARNDGVTAARVLVAGGLQRRITNYARQTVMTSAIKDPNARGWQRVGDGDSCDFCSMLLGRGSVYTETSVDFLSHDACGCGAAPAW